MRTWPLIVAGLVGPAPAAAAEARAPTAEIVVLDGDTLRARIGGEWRRLRLAAIDAPEMARAACAAERELGRAAAAFAGEMISGAREATIVAVGAGRRKPDAPWPTDRFGRILAAVLLDGRDLGAALVAAGHALPWRGGAAAKAERRRLWCKR